MSDKNDRTNDKARFALTHYPLPKSAQGKTFYDKGAGYTRLRRALRQTLEDRTVGVLYLCNTSGSPLDLYRAIAGEIGVRPSHR
jgi:hypothetical protein